MELIRWFKDITKDDIAIVGGKGANLGEMFEIMPIPDGFCVTADAYTLFLDRSGIKDEIQNILSGIDYEDSEKLDNISEKIRNKIIEKDMPDEIKNKVVECYSDLKGELVAVRSSATAEDLPDASFAGQQDTYLNISGKINVLDAVRRCWASLFTSRAIYYRNTNDFKHEDVRICVVVQKMVQSEKAGVMFTVNPITQDTNEMIIEGNYGLGESVVSGKVTPDTYIVIKEPFSIKDINIGSKSISIVKGKDGKTEEIEVDEEKREAQLLDDDELKKLSKLAIEIEKHYNKPQDIEWGIEDGEIFILQSRPITTLG